MFVFFFQAEDGIRDLTVTGVQTCALPILTPPPVPKLGVVKLSTSVARALSRGTAEVSTARFPVGSVPATETIKRPDTAAQLSRTSVSVGPESSSVPLVVAAAACAYPLDRSTVRLRPSRCDSPTRTVHSTTWSNA